MLASPLSCVESTCAVPVRVDPGCKRPKRFPAAFHGFVRGLRAASPTGRRAALPLCAALLALTLVDAAGAAAGGVTEPASFRLDTVETARHAPAERLARDVVLRDDARGRPFVVVDKPRAEILVYAGDGRLVGRSPALLGAAPGDASVPGVGERTQRRALQPEDRTTPAGRFVARLGRNHTGEQVVWVDWNAALAIHRLRDGPGGADRQQRLRRPPAHRRVSDGCVVVPGVFFDRVVLPTLSGGRALVYILPEQPGRGTLEAFLADDARSL